MNAEKTKQIVIVGGGAAGFFAANVIMSIEPDSKVVIIEKTTKVLTKVKVSGGGRCNVTHHCFEHNKLANYYPRGGDFLKKLFPVFGPAQTIAWFAERGIELKTEADNRMFPVSNDSQTIVDCLYKGALESGVRVWTDCGLKNMQWSAETQQWTVDTSNEQTILADRVIITTGSNQQMWEMLKKLGCETIPPVPSLFTFNIRNEERLADLPGVTLPEVELRLAGKKFKENGPYLITHWGMSGPAVLKLSARAARELNDMHYRFQLMLNLVPKYSFDELQSAMSTYKNTHPLRLIASHPLFDVPTRLWERLCAVSGIEKERKWQDVAKKQFNKLSTELNQGLYNADGKTTFKEEFVTAGGIDLSTVHPTTMESKVLKNVFFAGEVLDIDALTGGFNFQAAWTTAFMAAKAVVDVE